MKSSPKGKNREDLPRNNGIDADGVAQTEADHFVKCPAAINGSTCAISVRCWSMFTVRRSKSLRVRPEHASR